MTNDNLDELMTNAINSITEQVSDILLQEFLKLPKELRMNIILIKSAQLLLSNVLCHVAMDNSELDKIIHDQGDEIKELTYNCAFTAFANKFNLHKH